LIRSRFRVAISQYACSWQSITGDYGKRVASIRAFVGRFARIDAHFRESDNESFAGTHISTMKNGLYSIHVSLQDGRVGKGSGVVVFRDGKIFGGDAYLFYTGTYTVKDNTFKGEVLVQRHTSSPDANPLFGGPSPVGVGVSGSFTDTRGVMNGTALVGKASQIFGATLRKLADID
jgi:T3SS negative regulator,GrlR